MIIEEKGFGVKFGRTAEYIILIAAGIIYSVIIYIPVRILSEKNKLLFKNNIEFNLLLYGFILTLISGALLYSLK